jgi:DNA repair protein RadC
MLSFNTAQALSLLLHSETMGNSSKLVKFRPISSAREVILLVIIEPAFLLQHMSYSLRITDLPADERPRERLLSNGAKNLTTAELIAILLGTGQGPGKLSAVGLGQHILSQLGRAQRDPLDRLREVSAAELIAIPGVGPAKATSILAGLELGKRAFQVKPSERTIIDSPGAAAAALSHDLMWMNQEHFAVLLLETIGSATETLAPPREIFREVLRQGATRVIVAHNHPSGSLEPSPEDLQLTEQLLAGAKLLDLPVLDHLILGNGDWVSLRQTTELWASLALD